MILSRCIWQSCIYFHSKNSRLHHNQGCGESIGHSSACRTFILVRGCIPLHYTVLHFDFIIHTDITDRRLARSLSLRRISHVDCMTFTSHIPWNMIWASVCYHQPMVMVVVPSQAPLCRDARGALLPSSFVSQPVHNTPIHSVIGRPRVV